MDQMVSKATATAGKAGQDFLISGITLAAILLLVGTGTNWARSIIGITEMVAQSQSAITATFLLNIALILFGWRRFRELQVEIRRRTDAEAEALMLACNDPLTGLLNRRAFTDRGEAALADWHAAGFNAGALIVDIDSFKTVNDLFGHGGGDTVLVDTVERIRNLVPASALVARLGGDEFAIILPIARDNDAALDELGEQLASNLVFTFDIGGVTAAASASIGGTIGDMDGLALQDLLRHADAAMYRAKRLGRARYYRFNGAMELALARSDIIESDLRRGIAADEPYPVYEPLVDLSTGDTLGYEMLARWTSPVLGDVSPTEFIPVAEQKGMIGNLADQLFRKAFLDAANWPQHLCLSVNVSPIQLRDPWFAQKLLKLVSECGLSPRRLVIEITESAIIDNLAMTGTLFESLRNLGVRIALDDFGTGYSSIASLRSLPFDTVKLDREYVMRLVDNGQDDQLAQAVIALGQSLGLPVVAEGIESAEIAVRLAGLGCAIGQGRRWGKAVSGAELQTRFTGDPDIGNDSMTGLRDTA